MSVGLMRNWQGYQGFVSACRNRLTFERFNNRSAAMRNDLTDITVVIDRSGSMSHGRDDSEGGVNQFIKEQKAAEGEATLTLVQFDNEYEFIHKGIDIKDAPAYRLKPRGGTALLDAVGRAITEAGERLAALSEDQRPANVVFVIVTDGQENASREFSRDKVREMITHQQDAYKWSFVFLGANAAAFAQAGQMGVKGGTSAQYNANAPMMAYTQTSAKLASLRSATSRGMKADMDFTDAEKAAMASGA